MSQPIWRCVSACSARHKTVLESSRLCSQGCASVCRAQRKQLSSNVTNDFQTSSQAFKKSHGGGGGGGGEEKGNEEEGGSGKPGFVVAAGGMGKIRELIVEPPNPRLYNAVIIEPVPPEHQGGLWEFEDEASYFDGDM